MPRHAQHHDKETSGTAAVEEFQSPCDQSVKASERVTTERAHVPWGVGHTGWVSPGDFDIQAELSEQLSLVLAT